MRIDEYIKSLRRKHIIITFNGSELKIKASKEVLSEGIIGDIKEKKAEIIEFYKTQQSNHVAYSIPKAEDKVYYRLSSAQKRMYFLHAFNKTSLSYNMPMVLELKGVLDMKRLQGSFAGLVDRHESLRTSFTMIEDQVLQKIGQGSAFSIDLAEADREGAVHLIDSFVRPFDLSEAPLIRAGVISLSAGEHILMVDMHHIIADGVSKDILIRDFMALYRQEILPDLSLQYKDYSEWQQGQGQQERTAIQKSFWLKIFEEAAVPLELPADHPRPTVKSGRGDYFSFSLPAGQTSVLRNVAASEGVSMFMVVLAIFNILLSKLCNQEDIVIGIPAAGRQHADLEDTIGMFVNTLPLRNYPKGRMTFNEFLRAVKSNTLEGLAHQEYQYEDLLEVLKIPRDSYRNPLFDVMLSYRNFEEASLELPGLTIASHNNAQKISKFDLTLDVSEGHGELLFGFEYSTDLFRRETIGTFSRYLLQIVHEVTRNSNARLSNIQILSEPEKDRILNEWNDTRKDYPADRTIVDLFEEQASKTPGRAAVFCDGKVISYARLQEQSDAIASYLIDEQGVGCGDPVGVLLSRQPLLLPVLLGILKSGAAYVPIDPHYPVGRIHSILQDARIKVLLTSSAYDDGLSMPGLNIVNLNEQWEVIRQRPGRTLRPAAKPRDIAYIIYTSGSTGNPKGVMVEHRSLVNYISWAASYYIPQDEASGAAIEVFPLYTSLSFDLTVTSIYTPLITGNAILIYRDEGKEILVEKVFMDNTATVIKLTPSHLKIIRDSGWVKWNEGYKRKKLIVGGENLETELALSIYEKFKGDIEIYNEYGPTEATVGCMTYRYDPEEDLSSVPIGHPIANMRICILDKDLNIVPVGGSGELYIGGDGLARGYANLESLTAERFIGDPYVKGERLYKSGDLARQMRDGKVAYLGRIDEQVKIRGFRIEPGEIAHQLNQHEWIRESVVVAREREGEKYLVAYYVTEPVTEIPDGRPEPMILKEHLQQRLPEYMIPLFFVPLDQLPLTSNGKLDWKALPEADIAVGGSPYIAPANEIEEKLVELWGEVLKIDQTKISVNANFFELGGDFCEYRKIE